MNTANYGYREKRNYIRMKVDTPVAIVCCHDGSSVEGICRDLSGGGLMIELNTTFPVGTQMEVTISSGHAHNPILKAKTEVTRIISQPDSEEQPCLLGMQILEVLS
ncbi:PilZ domain-containing protein [Agarilytica rhodophyticola]|uniref:PilZ domain-containing protein n=1 Tax=Agarilytica rhodophyticola TaxID=1737490 RepID=UPI000B3432D0|nr:PilZ domain-containing protein [Agarilytica rhodophyticola]